MKLLRLTTNYPVYLDKFYAQHSELSHLSYQEQYKSLMEDSFGWADFWTESFGKLGYSVWEPVSNAFPQQKKWAEENGIQYDPERIIYDISKAQVQAFQPDILFINDYHTFSYDFIKELREANPCIKMVIGWCGAPFSDEKVFRAYDLTLTNLPQHLETFSKMGLNVKLMKHAFEPRILDRIKDNPKQGFTFVGSVVPGHGFHNERLKLLSEISRLTDIEIYSDLAIGPIQEYKRIYRKARIQNLLDTILPNRRYFRRVNRSIKYMMGIDQDYWKIYSENFPIHLVKKTKPGLFGLSMYQKISDSLVTLNQHIDISKGSSNNMRLYEATGVGTCLLTDWSEDLSEKFEIDSEIVTYKSQSELISKWKYLKKNPKEAIEIGKRAQARTLRENTFSHRAEWLDGLIRQWIER